MTGSKLNNRYQYQVLLNRKSLLVTQWSALTNYRLKCINKANIYST